MLPVLTVDNEPDFVDAGYQRYPSFKHYLMDMGIPVYGRASLWYSSQIGEEETSRVVDVIRYKPNGRHTQFLGFCYLRNSYRVFTIESVWGLRDRLTGIAHDDVLGWLQSIEGAPTLNQQPTAQELAEWTVAPVIPSMEQAKSWLTFLGDEICRNGGAGYEWNLTHSESFTEWYWSILTPKKRGSGSMVRANITFRPSTVLGAIKPDGEILNTYRFCIKPWQLYIHRTKENLKLEHFSAVRTKLKGESFY